MRKHFEDEALDGLTKETLTAIRRARAVATVSEVQGRSVQRGRDAITITEIDADISTIRRVRRQQSKSAL